MYIGYFLIGFCKDLIVFLDNKNFELLNIQDLGVKISCGKLFVRENGEIQLIIGDFEGNIFLFFLKDFLNNNDNNSNFNNNNFQKIGNK